MAQEASLEGQLVAPLDGLLDGGSELLDRPGVAGYGVALAVVEERGRVLVAHGEEGHGALDVGVVAADDVARGDVDDILALVGEQGLDLAVDQADGGPAGEEDGRLDAARAALLLGAASLLEDEGGGGGSTLRVTQDALMESVSQLILDAL